MKRKNDGTFVVAIIGNIVGFIIGWFLVGPKISDKLNK